MQQVDLDALDRLHAEGEGKPIEWGSYVSYIWDAYPALAAELREARSEVFRLQQAYAASVQDIAKKSRELYESGLRISNQRKHLAELEKRVRDLQTEIDARDRRMKALGAAEELRQIVNLVKSEDHKYLTAELLEARAAELEAAVEGEEANGN